MFIQNMAKLPFILSVIVICICFDDIRAEKPNIVFLVADDLGWNDVSWNNKDMIMPNLGGLARAGVILNQSYVQPLCTPSRVAFMTGYYPYHVGRQNGLIQPLSPTGLSTNYTLLPERLQRIGYKTHMVGKWHLGHCNLSYTPRFRGFDSFFGYYIGAEDYYNHTLATPIPGTNTSEMGFDFWNDTEPAWDLSGKYSTNVLKKVTVNIISKHDSKYPLFLYLPFQAVHSPVEVPSRFERMYTYRNITRRKYCGMVSCLDEAVGDIVKALADRGMWNNTIFIFTTDNGGQTLAGGNNWPLRGNKNTLWEGGTRGAAFVFAQGTLGSAVNNNLIHAVDWFPTILEMAGDRAGPDIDGISQWSSFKGAEAPRHSFVYNFYDDPEERGAIRQGPYKLLVGNPGQPSGWIPPPEGTTLSSAHSLQEREEGHKFHLFNIYDDPEERHELSALYPVLTCMLYTHFQYLRSTMVSADDPPPDPEGRPSKWGGLFGPGWCHAK